MPGFATFRKLIDAVAGPIGRELEDPEAFRTATLIWQQLHGIVSLRISRPRFPWAPLADAVADAVGRIIVGVPSP